MANIKEIADELCSLTQKEANELAAVMKDEYGIEASSISYEIEQRREEERKAVMASSPKQYGIKLLKTKKYGKY